MFDKILLRGTGMFVFFEIFLETLGGLGNLALGGETDNRGSIDPNG